MNWETKAKIDSLEQQLVVVKQENEKLKAAYEKQYKATSKLLDDNDRLEEELSATQEQVKTLREAAIAVVERWDTPLWKDVQPTAEFIGRLRTALAATAPKGETE